MNIVMENYQGFPVIAPEGEIDMFNSKELRSAIEGVIEKDQARLILDMKSVKLLDSSGIAVLVSLKRKLDTMGGCMKLVHLHPDVSRVLDITGLLPYLDIFSDMNSAVSE